MDKRRHNIPYTCGLFESCSRRGGVVERRRSQLLLEVAAVRSRSRPPQGQAAALLEQRQGRVSSARPAEAGRAALHLVHRLRHGGQGGGRRAAESFRSSSSSESLWMVMMLTAGLGVSEMTMGWDWSPATAGAPWTAAVAGDTGLQGKKTLHHTRQQTPRHLFEANYECLLEGLRLGAELRGSALQRQSLLGEARDVDGGLLVEARLVVQQRDVTAQGQGLGPRRGHLQHNASQREENMVSNAGKEKFRKSRKPECSEPR
ncbi:hypothetical protein EYF80_039029 [Liparis tanakae]|uniref:Uncharacterized protein n=1 Tax=Liparis tanakae TaxID=230148 RepID=A0A4Z2GDH1_9TELE|nr:hypothetical protein EYF80_039029 [Liparis tanakae]